MPVTESRSHAKYKSGIVTAVIVSLVIGLVAGYGAGTVVTGSNDAYARAHESLTSSFLVSGNVTIGYFIRILWATGANACPKMEISIR
ncbi:hypothetical protein E6H18_10195 [Candidatus Bathyarchaeota archaeon]|nr:MAG: hypothetical protein E6H18_10195 [Candidatus Bathyarchaeota archaeon]